MKTPEVFFALCLLPLLNGPARADWTDVPDVGPGVCVANCGDNSPPPSPGYTAPAYQAPAGPSPEELRQQRETKDMQEASQDADDKGVAAYSRGDYGEAVRRLREALSYAPDDPDIQHNLQKAQAALDAQHASQLRASLAASPAIQQLKSAEYHSGAATHMGKLPSKMESGQTFDTNGGQHGTITMPVQASSGSRDPVIPELRLNDKLRSIERDREILRKNNEALEAKRKTLDPAKDAVEISRIKQKESDNENKVHYLNFSITEELSKPTPASQKNKN